MSRLVVVSNRVSPIQEGEATAGGLAAGVLDALKGHGGVWFGWSGNIADNPEPNPAREVGPITLFTIDLSREQYDQYYRGFANGTLWPALHYQIGLGRYDRAEFAGYKRVNDLFARSLLKLIRPDDLIWAHDYHLLCLADSLRAMGVTNLGVSCGAFAVEGQRFEICDVGGGGIASSKRGISGADQGVDALTARSRRIVAVE